MLSGEDLEPLYEEWDKANKKMVSEHRDHAAADSTPVFDPFSYWKVEGPILSSADAYWFRSAGETNLYGPYASLLEAREAFKWYCKEVFNWEWK